MPIASKKRNFTSPIFEGYNSKASMETNTLIDDKSAQREASRDKVFKRGLSLMGWFTLLLMIGMFITLTIQSELSIKTFGFSFYTSAIWDPVRGIFGALPFLIGTLLSSVLALAISLPFSIAISLYLGEHVKQGIAHTFLSSTIDLLAGIPSVIYGFWGLLVLVPIVRQLEMSIGVIPYGVGIFSASIILALMIIPFSASLGKEIVSMVPQDLKEAAYALGATPLDVTRRVILPYAKSGLFAGILMSFGRALSETMAVTMVIGNANKIPQSIFSPGNTLASVIANEFAEAAEALYLSSLVQLGLLLFIVTGLTSFIGRYIIKRLAKD